MVTWILNRTLDVLIKGRICLVQNGLTLRAEVGQDHFFSGGQVFVDHSLNGFNATVVAHSRFDEINLHLGGIVFHVKLGRKGLYRTEE